MGHDSTRVLCVAEYAGGGMIEKPSFDFNLVACEAWAQLVRALGDYDGAGQPLEHHAHFNVAIDSSQSQDQLLMSVRAAALALAVKIKQVGIRFRTLQLPFQMEGKLFVSSSGASLRVVHVYSPPVVSEDETITVPEMWVLRLDVGGTRK